MLSSLTEHLAVRRRPAQGGRKVLSTAEQRGGEGGPPKVSGRLLAVHTLAIVGLLALVAFVISGVVPGSGGRLGHTAIGWMAVAVGAELFALASYALLFHGVFSRGEYRIKPLRSAQIAVGELGAFVVSPTGAGGPALRIWALLRGGMPFRTQMRRGVVHYSIFEVPYIGAAVLLGVGAIAGIGVGHARTVVALAPVFVVIPALLLVASAIVLARRPARSDARWRRIGRDVLEAIPDGVRQVLPRLRSKAWLLLSSIGYWAGDCGVLVLAVHAVHGSAPIAVIVLAYMLGQLGNALPLPGGVGGVEPVMLGVLTSSGVNLGLGAAAVVLYRLSRWGSNRSAERWPSAP